MLIDQIRQFFFLFCNKTTSANSMIKMTSSVMSASPDWKTAKMRSQERVRRNRIKLAATDISLKQSKCLIALYIVRWEIKCLGPDFILRVISS